MFNFPSPFVTAKILLRRSMRWLCLTGVLVLSAGLHGCGGGSGGDDEEPDVSDIPITTTDFDFELSAEQIIAGNPAPAAALGTANFETQARGTFEIYAAGTVTFTDFDATSVGLYAGFAGEEGNYVLSLESTGTNTWAFPNNTEIDDSDLYRLQTTGFYVLAQSPHGNLRGQILPTGWDLLMFDVGSGQVVPPQSSSARGRGGLTVLVGSSSSRYTYHLRVTTNNLSGAAAANLRESFAGANGDSAVDLVQSTSDSSVWGTGDVNDINYAQFFSSSGLERLWFGQFYVSIESPDLPGGKIRGQLLPEGLETFVTELSAAEVVSLTQVTNTATARAVTTYREETGEIAINVWTEDIAPFSVALYEGSYGQNGMQLFYLSQAGFDSPFWSLPLTTLSDQEKELLQSQSLYLQISSNTNPDGELRGQLLLDENAPITSITLNGNGGKLTLNDPAGSRFELNLSSTALFEETTLTMERTELPDVFPAGIRPLSAVRLGPDGTRFSEAPRITIEGDSTSSNGWARAGYLINSDGVIEYTPLLGEDAIEAALEFGQNTFDVLHFSTAGVVEIDPFSLERIPEPIPSNQSAESWARQKLAKLLTDAANEGGSLDQEAVEDIFATWASDISTRAQSLAPTTFKSFSDFVAELFRYNVLSEFSQRDADTFGNQYSSMLYSDFTNHLNLLESSCVNGDTTAYVRFLTWLGVANPYFNSQFGDLPVEMEKLSPGCLFSMSLSTDQTLFALQGGQSPEAEVTLFGPEGEDITGTVAMSLLGFGWDIEDGFATTERGNIYFDTSDIGLITAAPRFYYHTVGEELTAVIVPEHRGNRQILAFGSASDCPDPENNGELFGGQVVPVTINSLTITPISDDAVSVTISGSGGVGDISINSIAIVISYDDFTPTTVSGTATGSISYSYQELDEETGVPITITGNLNLNMGAATDIIDFSSVEGTDSLGCQLSGDLTLGDIL